jgi:hypothetical protein
MVHVFVDMISHVRGWSAYRINRVPYNDIIDRPTAALVGRTPRHSDQRVANDRT